MNELQDIKDQLDFSVSELTNGFMTILKYDTGITKKSQIGSFKNETILSGHLYDKNDLYKVVYIKIDSQGQLIEVLHESEGVLPNLFMSENKEIWCLLTDTSTDKDLEIILPIKNRFDYSKPKGKRQFPGKFVGSFNNIGIIHDNDIYFSKSPDKILKIEFKNNKVKSQKQLKISTPVNNKIIIDSDGNLQLLARQKDKFIHRKCDLNGEILFQREIPFIMFNSYELLNLDEKGVSKVIFTESNKICIGSITADSEITDSVVFENKSDIFNLWKPIQFGENTWLIRFNFETGNGWLIIKEDSLLDCFIHDDFNGYKSLVTNEIIQIQYNDLILSDITKVNDYYYCVSIYPRSENPKENKELIILNKRITTGNTM
ncbi:MAG: hypothetical protein P1U70_16125 [Saprospiraceae bacterium]|nr:hypothetical protein [Saprospiraceae bacterium]